MKKIFAAILVAALVLSLCACSQTVSNESPAVSSSAAASSAVTQAPAQETAQENEAGHYPVTIDNYNYKKEVIQETFQKAPEKVFAVYQDSIETLLALGLEDKIVACAGLDQDVKDEYKDAFSKVNYLTDFSPSKENVVMLQPDFILSWYSYFSDKKLGDVDYWHQNNINTYMMQNSGCAPELTLENEYTDILNLGKIFNVEDKAASIVNDMKSQVEKVASAAKNSAVKPRVLVMEFEDKDIRVYGDNTLGGDMVRQLGADLVVAPNNKMSGEDLIAADPDVIFTVYFGSSESISDAQSAVEKLTGNADYASLSAVKNNKVFAIPLGEMYCSGTRTLDGIQRLAQGIYPDLAE
jgi:iron complex transport system substrate-binding protein